MDKTLFLLLVTFILASCTNINTTVDKSNLRSSDYRLFQGTPVWPLAKAAYDNDLDEVARILKSRPELANIPDSVYGGTMLMKSITLQNYDLFKVLLENGANVNYHDKSNDISPLMEACSVTKGDSRFVRDLINKGAKVNDTSARLGTPMFMAVTYSTLPIVRLLKQNGANMNYRIPLGYNILSRAIIVKNYDIALFLLENGVDYNQPTKISRDEHGQVKRQLNILETLRYETPSIISSDFNKKQRIIAFLESNGLDYHATPIPDIVIKEIKEEYPVIWRYYLNNY